MRLLDLSWSGCLVASSRAIEPGTTGELRINVDGTEYHDAVHVVRSQDHGASPAFTLAARFGWGQRPSTASVRGKIPAVVTLP